MAPHAVPRQGGTEQVLPPWLTYSPIVVPTGTSYTILRLPLTYYGPSIPLGTDGTWTYGGLSSPAPSATPSLTATSSAAPVTTSPPTTTSATSTTPSSSTLPTTSSTTLSTTSSLSTPATTTFATQITSRTPTMTTSATPSSTSAPGAAAHRLPVVAIILIALGALAAVLLCCIISALLWRRRKSRREREPPRGDSEFYAGPGDPNDDSLESEHVVPALTGERNSLLGNDSFVVVGPGAAATRSPPMAQRSINGVSYQRLGGSRAPSHSSHRTGSDEIGVAYTDMPPPRTRRRTVTAVSNAMSSSPSHPTSSSQPAIGSMRTRSQRSSLFERPAEEDESPVLPRDSAHGVVRRASDLDQRPLPAPAPAAAAAGATLGAELGMLGLGTRYPDPSQSLLATSSSGGSMPPRLIVPTPSSLGSRSRIGMESSRPPSQMFASSQTGSRASRGHSPAPSYVPGSPPLRDTESPVSEHDESAQLLTAERGNVRSGVGLLGRFSWFARGSGRRSPPPARTSRTSYPGWMSPPTEEGFLAEADSNAAAGPSATDPPTLESKPPVSFPGMVRLVTSRDREQPPTDPSAPRPISAVSGNTIYHDAPSQPATPRSAMSTWLGFLGRSSSTAGPAPPVPTRPSPLSHASDSTPVAEPPTPPRAITPPEPAHRRGSSGSDVDPASRLTRDELQPPSEPSSESDILDAPAPESLLEVPAPATVPPSPATVANAPVFPPGLLRLPRTWNFGLLNELGDEPPAPEERWANIRSTPSLNWNLRRFSLGQAVRINSPQAVTDSQVGSVHGDGTSNGRSANSRSGHSHSPSMASDPQVAAAAQRPLSGVSTRSRYSQTGGTMYSEIRRPTDPEQQRTIDRTLSMSAMTSGTAPSQSADTTTVSSNTPYPPETLVTESGRFGFEFGTFGFGDDVDSEGYDYETRATTVSSGTGTGSSGHDAVDLHADGMRRSGQELGRSGWAGRVPPMSAFGQSDWAEQLDADLGRA